MTVVVPYTAAAFLSKMMRCLALRQRIKITQPTLCPLDQRLADVPKSPLCVHLRTPSHDRPEAERVYELQAGLYEFQFRKVLFVSFRIECHETIRLRQGMRSNDEISKQTPQPLLRGSSSPLCVPCKPPASL